jgi:hypothetical protein
VFGKLLEFCGIPIIPYEFQRAFMEVFGIFGI